MTVLITSDWHLSGDQRDFYRFEAQKTFRRIIREKNVKLVLMLGDLTEVKDRHSSLLVNSIVGSLAMMAELCPVVIMRGNHDALDPQFPFFRFVEFIPNIHWVNDPVVSIFPVVTKLLGRVLFLPHTRDWAKDWKDVRFSGHDWIFAHATFTGADLGNGQVGEGVPLKVFPKGARVISGDIHIGQVLGPVTYVGAPYTVDFGDEYEPRALLIKDGKVSSLPVPGAQKRLIEVSKLADLNKARAKPGDIVKVRYLLAPEDVAKWSEIRSKIDKWAGDADVVLHVVQPLVPNSGKLVARRKDVPVRSDSQIMKRYAKRRAVDDKTLDVGLDLMDNR